MGLSIPDEYLQYILTNEEMHEMVAEMADVYRLDPSMFEKIWMRENPSFVAAEQNLALWKSIGTSRPSCPDNQN